MRTRRETDGTEPIRRTGCTEPVPYFTTPIGEMCIRDSLTYLPSGSNIDKLCEVASNLSTNVLENRSGNGGSSVA